MKKNRLAAVLAAAVLVTSVVPLNGLINQTAYAATAAKGKEVEVVSNDGRVTVDGFTFTIEGSEATITGYQGTSKDLAIPTKITIPDNSNNNTSNATTSSKTGGLAKIYAASSSSSTSGTSYNVTSIANDAFSGKLGISTVTMQGGTNADGNAYGIRRIGDRAFFGCQDLTTITIAGTTTSIGENALADCVALKTITVSEGNPTYKSIEGALYSYSTTSGTGSYTMVQYPLGSTSNTYAVPSAIATTLTGIGSGAFWGSPYLDTITLPASVKTIGADAFAECKQLSTMTLPDGLTNLGAEAFMGCNALKSVNVPSGIKTIGNSTFQNCAALTTVTLPQTITSIGAYAFYGCSSLTDFEVPASTQYIGDQAFAYCTNLMKISIPVVTTSFGASVFAGSSKVIVYTHSGSQAANYAKNNNISTEQTYTVRFYSDSTYANLLSSQEVVANGSAVPPTMDERSGYQLSWSTSYTNVTSDLRIYAVWDRTYTVKFIDDYNDRSVEQNVVDGQYAVAPLWTMTGYSLSWDTSVSSAIHSNVTAHAVWTSDTTGYIINQSTTKPQEKGASFTSGNYKYIVTSANVEKPTVAFAGVATSSTAIVIPSTVTVEGVTYYVKSISASALAGDKNLKSITIGAQVKTIGKNAFNGCTNLSKIRILSKGVTTVGSKAFYKIKSGAKFYCVTSKKSAYLKLLKKSGMKAPKVYSL